ncbi:hypothetical protein V8G54_001688 [Vigna mungo]|uniref:Zinc finger LSD1-type domain-containing protein n=1 Tax=Vigna mungo TaxID=3915 RepID=A0AAQ3P896_VIGMU
MKAPHQGGNQSQIIRRHRNSNRRCNPNHNRNRNRNRNLHRLVDVVGIRWSVVLVIACFHIHEVPNMLNVHAVGLEVSVGTSNPIVGQVECGSCAVLLMYPFGASHVKCSSCQYVTEIGAHNERPPWSIQQRKPVPAKSGC